MKNLSDKKVYIRDMFDKEFGYCQVEDIDRFFGKNCPIVGIENYGNREYYHVLTNIPYGKDYYPGVKASPYIVMVENGIFKGCACIVEEYYGINRHTDVALISNKTIFKFPSFDGILLPSEIDYIVGENGFCEVLANELSCFDVSKQYQYFEFMCEDVPTAFWQNKNNVARLLRSIESNNLKLENVFNPEFVNEKAMKRFAKDIVLSYAKKNLDEETEIEK